MNAARTTLVICATLVGTAGLACRRHQQPAPWAVSALPRLGLSPQQARALARIELSRPGDDDPTRRSTIVLERRGDAWRLLAPVRARASADKVAALVANMQDLRLSRRLDGGTAFYERFDLTEAKALHVVASTSGGQNVVDFLAGKGSEQGQVVRLPGVPGIFALVNEGPNAYRGFLYTRDLRGWRDPGLLSFEEPEVEAVEITNGYGSFSFRRRDPSFRHRDPAAPEPGGWTAAFAPRRRDGALGPARRAWPRFDPSRVDEMMRAYHALAADDFGVPADRANAGLEDAERTGGVVRIHLLHAPRPLVLRVGAPAPQRSRFAIAGSRWATIGEAADSTEDDDAPCAISPWTARWAIGDPRLFERPR